MCGTLGQNVAAFLLWSSGMPARITTFQLSGKEETFLEGSIWSVKVPTPIISPIMVPTSKYVIFTYFQSYSIISLLIYHNP
jgi:hypothetical protein